MKKIPPFVKNNKIYLGGKKKTKRGVFIWCKFAPTNSS